MRQHLLAWLFCRHAHNSCEDLSHYELGDIFSAEGFEESPAQGERKPAGVSGGIGRPQVLQYGTLGAEKHSTCVLAVRPGRAERTAWRAVRMRLS